MLMCIIIIYYKVQYNYYISNKGILKEYDEKEHVAVTAAATDSCFKRRL